MAAASPQGGAPLKLGSRCHIPSYGDGTVCFVGQTAFAHSLWVGVSLDEPKGKNNGVVNGKRYFDADDAHGLFVRPSQVRILSLPEDEEEEDQEQDNEAQLDGDDDDEELLQDEELPELLDDEEPVPAPKPPAIRRTTAPSPIKRPALTASSSRSSTSAAVRPRPSSTAPVAASAALARRTGSPTKPGAGAQSPAKLAPPSATASGRLSSASSRISTPLRRPTSSAASSVVSRYATGSSATQSRVASPATPAVSRLTRAPAATARVGAAASASAAKAPATAARAIRPGQTVPGRATDAVSAKAGLRPVARTRPSMAPSASGGNSPLKSTTPLPRTTIGGARVTAPTPGRTPLARATTGTARAPVITPQQRRATRVEGDEGMNHMPPPRAAARASSSTKHSDEAEDEDLRDISLEEVAMGAKKAAQGLGLEPGGAADASLDDDEDEGLPGSHEASPSARKALSRSTNHMSLSSVPPSASSGTFGAPGGLGAAEAGALQRELDELRVRIRLLEKRREEDRDKMREMERVKEDADNVLTTQTRLTAKNAEMQSELRDLHKMERDWTAQKEDLERQIAELTDQMEMATLDKEMAEERAEAAKEELEEIKERFEELSIELEVVKAEKDLEAAEEAEGRTLVGEEAEKRTASFLQLEKQNERLKDALVRLRDLTAEQDAEQKRRISELERELDSLSELQAQYESAASTLQNAELQIEDLKLQLDDALGAEEMLEQLTDRNLYLSEKIEELTATVEELEVLKELNDELEETHVETEKQLQEEVDLKDLHIRELRQRSGALEANVVDYETTFRQFRELVLNLQTEVETLRAEQEEARGAEGGEGGVGGAGGLASQSQAMINLNMKLQTSALKSQAMTIDLELGKMEAAQAMAHLEMLRPYLPAAYFEADSDSVDALLFFNRVAQKADLIKTTIEGSHDIAGALASVVPEHLIGVCRMRQELARFSAVSRQISCILKLCSVPTFLKAGRLYRENAQMERRIDQFVDALRREELKEAECLQDFKRLAEGFHDLEGALAVEGDSDLAAKEVGSTILLDHGLDTLSVALGFAKQTLASLYADQEVEWQMLDEASDADRELFEPLQLLLNRVKACKVPARKLLRRLSNLYDNDEAIRLEAIVALPSLGHTADQLLDFASHLSERVSAMAADVRVSKSPVVLRELLELVSEGVKENLGGAPSQERWATPLETASGLGESINALLNAATEQENVIKISGSRPWLARVEQLRSEAAQNADAERQVAKLSEDAKDLYRQIKARDQALQEGAVKMERLQKQVEKNKEQAQAVLEMRSSLGEATKQSKAYQEMNESLQAEMEGLEKEIDRLKEAQSKAQVATAAGAKAVGLGLGLDGQDAAREGEGAGVGSALLGSASAGGGSLETAYLVEQLEALRGALRYLRSENALLKGRGLAQTLESLDPLVDVGEVVKEQEEAEAEVGVPVKRSASSQKGVVVGDASSAGGSEPLSLAAQGKALYSQLLHLAATPRIVLLPTQGAVTAAGEQDVQRPIPEAKARSTWQPFSSMPEGQLRAQRQARSALQARVDELSTRLRERRSVATTGKAASRWKMPNVTLIV